MWSFLEKIKSSLGITIIVGVVLLGVVAYMMYKQQYAVSVGIIVAAVAAYFTYTMFFGDDTKKKSTISAEDIGNSFNGVHLETKVSEGFEDSPSSIFGSPSESSTADIISGLTITEPLPGVPAPVPIAPKGGPFVDMQPPTIAHIGLVNDGMDYAFDVEAGVMAAIKGGIRSLTIQIDMLERVLSVDFPEPGKPTLLYRSNDGTLICKNAGDLDKAMKAIANAAFTPTAPSNTSPILLYLHIVRAPNQITDPTAYKEYLSVIAKALAPLAPQHLGSTSVGNFHRQLKEEYILTAPLSEFSGQIIIMCNADTSIFKSKITTGVQPAEDLDYWVNMRVYAMDTADKNIGIALESGMGTTPSAVITSLSSILNLSEEDGIKFALSNRNRFMIAMPNSSENPTTKALSHALNTLGVNMVPVDFLIEGKEDALALFKEYGNMSWPEKADGLRSI